MATIKYCDYCDNKLDPDKIVYLNLQEVRDGGEAKPYMPEMELCGVCAFKIKKNLDRKSMPEVDLNGGAI